MSEKKTIYSFIILLLIIIITLDCLGIFTFLYEKFSSIPHTLPYKFEENLNPDHHILIKGLCGDYFINENEKIEVQYLGNDKYKLILPESMMYYLGLIFNEIYIQFYEEYLTIKHLTFVKPHNEINAIPLLTLIPITIDINKYYIQFTNILNGDILYAYK